ncbi:MAG: hypothetical protein M3R24_39690 [Chloroflexota bacterium]|nr:hypothetical protein [Chloroflexota bacterium]
MALLGAIAILGLLQGDYSDVVIAALLGISLALGRRRNTNDLLPLVFLYIMAGFAIVLVGLKLMQLL